MPTCRSTIHRVLALVTASVWMLILHSPLTNCQLNLDNVGPSSDSVHVTLFECLTAIPPAIADRTRYCLSKSADCGNKCAQPLRLLQHGVQDIKQNGSFLRRTYNVGQTVLACAQIFRVTGIRCVTSVLQPLGKRWNQVWKASPDEKVGVVAKKGGRPSVVEYSAAG